MKRLIAIVLSIVLLLTIVAACAEGDRPPIVDELLSLGEQFLLDGDYEQALVQFMQAIEVEPMNPRGYIGAAEAYVGLGQHDRAREVLEEGQRVVGDDAGISGMFEYVNRIEFETVIMQGLENMIEEFETNGYENLYEMLFQEMLHQMPLIAFMQLIGEFPYILLNDAGNFGVGVYLDESEIRWIYIGGYVDSHRSGQGIWFGAGGNVRFEGEWFNDLPNGSGVLLHGNHLMSGTLVNGLWDGAVAITYLLDSSFDTVQTYVNGKIMPIGNPFINPDGTLAWVIYTSDYRDVVTTNIDGLRGVFPFAEDSR